EQLEKLSRNTDDMAEMRHVIANQFRVFDRDAWSPVPWPWVYGDAMSLPPPETPRQNVALTSTQLAGAAQGCRWIHARCYGCISSGCQRSGTKVRAFFTENRVVR